MSAMERRKLACSVTFHAVAFTCVIWSLYVLIDRSAEEYSSGQLQWPFWTKLVVVAIGFTGNIFSFSFPMTRLFKKSFLFFHKGGVVFMYVQCTMYLTLCRRWRAYNRVIEVQNAPSRMAMNPTTTVTLGESSSKPGKRGKNDKKSSSAPVQSVVTIASAFAGSGRVSKVSSNVDPAEGDGGGSRAVIVNSELLHSEETAALIDRRTRPAPVIVADDSIPSI